MKVMTASQVREFLLRYYTTPLMQRGLQSDQIPDSFDFLSEGIIDSLGILDMVSAVEREVGFEINMEGLDSEALTTLGPFCAFVEQAAKAREQSTSA